MNFIYDILVVSIVNFVAPALPPNPPEGGFKAVAVVPLRGVGGYSFFRRDCHVISYCILWE